MRRTTEEKQAWKERMGELARKVRAMSSDEKQALVAKIGGIFTAEGHPLSPFNTIFLWNQGGENITQVGGFRQWQKVGRVVAKGEAACGVIYVPIGKNKSEEPDSETGGESEEKIRMRFRLVPVFDVSQTIEVEKEVA